MRYFKLKNIRLKNPFLGSQKFFRFALSSWKSSKFNYLVQTANLTLTFLLIAYILPVRIDEYLSQWESVKILYSYLPKVGISVILFFLTYVVTEMFGFVWHNLYQTPFRDSVSFFITLIAISAFLYIKALSVLLNRVYNKIFSLRGIYTNYV